MGAANSNPASPAQLSMHACALDPANLILVAGQPTLPPCLATRTSISFLVEVPWSMKFSTQPCSVLDVLATPLTFTAWYRSMVVTWGLAGLARPALTRLASSPVPRLTAQGMRCAWAQVGDPGFGACTYG